MRVDRRGGAASDPGRSVLRHATAQTRIRPTRGTPTATQARPQYSTRVPEPRHPDRTSRPAVDGSVARVRRRAGARCNARRDGLPRRFRSLALRACGAGRLALEQIPSKASTALGVPPEVCTRMSARLQRLSTVPLYELDAVMCTDPGGQQVVARRARRNWRPGTRRPTSSSAGTAPTRPATPAGTAGSIAGPRPALVST